jgi:hypothetical protein
VVSKSSVAMIFAGKRETYTSTLTNELFEKKYVLFHGSLKCNDCFTKQKAGTKKTGINTLKQLKMKILLVVGFVLILSTGCNTEPFEKSSLAGVWIEVTNKTDSLVFNNQFQGFSLKRKRSKSWIFIAKRTFRILYL